MADTYAAQVVEVPGEGIRLVPVPGSAAPDQPHDVNLLGMSVALALGAAEYEHHPEPRDPRLQTLDALLAGEATMPWRPGAGGTARGGEPYVVCDRSAAGQYTCAVEYRPPREA